MWMKNVLSVETQTTAIAYKIKDIKAKGQTLPKLELQEKITKYINEILSKEVTDKVGKVYIKIQ